MGLDVSWGGDIEADLFVVKRRAVEEVGHVLGQESWRRTERLQPLENEVKNEKPLIADVGGGRHLEVAHDPNEILVHPLEGSRVGPSIEVRWAAKSVKTLPIIRMMKMGEQLETHIVRGGILEKLSVATNADKVDRRILMDGGHLKAITTQYPGTEVT
jgi:hypothetical protein